MTVGHLITNYQCFHIIVSWGRCLIFTWCNCNRHQQCRTLGDRLVSVWWISMYFGPILQGLIQKGWISDLVKVLGYSVHTVHHRYVIILEYKFNFQAIHISFPFYFCVLNVMFKSNEFRTFCLHWYFTQRETTLDKLGTKMPVSDTWPGGPGLETMMGMDSAGSCDSVVSANSGFVSWRIHPVSLRR